MFDDIRPYRNDEVASVIQKLINEPALQASIAGIKLPLTHKIFPNLAKFIVKVYFKSRLRKFNCIDDIQKEVAKYLYHLIDTSCSHFSYNGISKIDPNKPSLFISNHRDIVMDVALVNLALYQSGITTVEAAVGDNLLNQPWVSDLMRLNKSFIVKRSEKTKRAMLTASKQLSSYIHYTLSENQQNIWIAQREGRAKDGIDKTNSALISMLLLNKSKETSISDYLEQLNIIPVAISYEFDPCDQDKAKELAAKEATGEYQKSENEDFDSITRGLVGKKGHVHIEFCDPILGDFEDSKAIAQAIDEKIIANYKLYDSNQKAYELLKNTEIEPSDNPLYNRLQQLTNEQKKWLLTMYANPVLAKETLNT
ncbi:1-acyl-sn-glycerol-3-phosphate acyltransferase [Colwellia sp. RE-S-Sl-9]